MTSSGADEAIIKFRSQLADLRQAVRSPTYGKLQEHANRDGRQLATSTTGDLLNGPGTPRWETVETFIRACRRHAQMQRLALPPEMFDLERWRAEHGRIEGSAVRASAAATQVTADARPCPRQLPAMPGLFVARQLELAALTQQARQGSTVVISAIGGAGGIGKTWLALQWAYQNLHLFPDGQLFIDLRGFDPTSQPMPPAVALRTFLYALGIGPAAMPVNVDSQIGLYRSLIADKRMLIVLDNARDTDQVVDLLPGSSKCIVLVTSRNQLAGLVTAYGAHYVHLGLFAASEACNLLGSRLSQQQLTKEPDAVAQLVAACGGLPLALAIAAARVTSTQSEFGLATTASSLSKVTSRLDALDEDRPHASLRAVLSGSYMALTPPETRVFSLLGLVASPDISAEASGALTNLSVSDVDLVLQSLERASLVQQPAPGRWILHDLVRLYAAERAHEDMSAQERKRALRRYVDFYLHSAYAADRMLEPSRTPISLEELPTGGQMQRFASYAAALEWLEVEHFNLLAVQRLAVKHDWHRAVWQLAWALDTFHGRRGQLQDLVDVWQYGLVAAREIGDAAIQARAHRLLGETYSHVGLHVAATEHLDQALALAESINDLASQGHTYYVMARAFEQRGDNQQAFAHAFRAMQLYENLENPHWKAETLNAVGWYLAQLDRYDEASAYLYQALAAHRRNKCPEGEAATFDSLGYLAHHTGHKHHAIEHYQNARSIRAGLGHSYDEANTIDRLGDAYVDFRETDKAQNMWQAAREMYLQQGRASDAERVQQKLEQLSTLPRRA
jgi:tetratricopeptide (TPR) repeat protein